MSLPGSYTARKIMAEINYKYSKVSLRPLRKYDRPCKCLICGRLLTTLFCAHAEKHGYSSKEDLIADGKIQWL